MDQIVHASSPAPATASAVRPVRPSDDLITKEVYLKLRQEHREACLRARELRQKELSLKFKQFGDHVRKTEGTNPLRGVTVMTFHRKPDPATWAERRDLRETREGSAWLRRLRHLTLCYLRGRSYAQCEGNRHEDQRLPQFLPDYLLTLGLPVLSVVGLSKRLKAWTEQ